MYVQYTILRQWPVVHSLLTVGGNKRRQRAVQHVALDKPIHVSPDTQPRSGQRKQSKQAGIRTNPFASLREENAQMPSFQKLTGQRYASPTL